MIKLISDNTKKNRGIDLTEDTHRKLTLARKKMQEANQSPRDNNAIINQSLELWHFQFDKELSKTTK